jgi:hypothetical protein
MTELVKIAHIILRKGGRGAAKQGWKVCQQGMRSASMGEEGRLMCPQMNLRARGDAPDESGCLM